MADNKQQQLIAGVSKPAAAAATPNVTQFTCHAMLPSCNGLVPSMVGGAPKMQ